MTRSWLIALLPFIHGCGDLPPRGQLLLHVTTDAPVPDSEQSDASLPPIVLFDRLRISVFPPEASVPCADCSRDFPIDRQLFERAEASVGLVLPPHEAGYRARVQLYLAEHISGAEPLSGATLESTVALPPTETEGVRHVSVALNMEDFGSLRGSLDSPAEWSSLRPEPGPMGVWPEARRTPCSSEPRDGEVCIPGGVFWMGSSTTLSSGEQPVLMTPKLVVVSPFFLGATEVSVADLRSAGVATDEGGRSLDPIEHGDAESPISEWCTFSVERRGTVEDALPVNCISSGLGAAYCAQTGATLPSEAQLAYASSGLDGSRFVWGADEPSCSDAVFARGGEGTYAFSTPDQCRGPGATAGPLSVMAGEGSRDRLVLPTGVVHSLAGNVSELARDVWQPWDGACWSGHLLRDPLCDTQSPSDTPRRVLRGGNWIAGAYALRAATRSSIDASPEASDTRLPSFGFRCARPGD